MPGVARLQGDAVEESRPVGEEEEAVVTWVYVLASAVSPGVGVLRLSATSRFRLRRALLITPCFSLGVYANVDSTPYNV